MLFYLTDKKATYFEIFFSIYLFLGFWFKYVFSLMLYEGRIYDSNVDQVKSTNIDEILILGVLIALTCLFSSFINKELKKKYPIKNKKNLEKSFFTELYLQNRIKVLIVFLLFIITVGLLNLKFGIYQRGFFYFNEIPSLIVNLIKWLLLFGFTTFSCFILHIEIKYLKVINVFTVIIMIFEVFLSYTSMLSRSFIINSSSLILPVYQQSLKLIKKYDIQFIILFAIIICSTVISVFEVNNIRLEKLEIVKKQYNELIIENLNNLKTDDLALKEKLNNYNFQIPKNKLESDKPILKNNIDDSETKIDDTTSRDVINFILINRWVGIDSLILVSNSKNKGYDLFFRALKEKKDPANYTFYEKEFNLVDVKTNVDTGKTIMKGNTLPGIISFLYYTGSPIFLLLSIMLIFFLFNFLENFLRNVTDNNLIFMCFISNMIATRLFHFGYAPKDSYLFLTSVLLSVLFLTLLMRFKFNLFR